jgi:zinc/manganese transport system permease protein
MIGPPAAARALTTRPGIAIALSTLIAVAIAWGAIALSYNSDWPIGFFVGALSAGAYALARLIQSWAQKV